MNELDYYINNLRENLDSNNETKLIMQIYIDLGLRFVFDEDFFFGGTKKKKELYFSSPSTYYLDKFFKSGKITCISSSYILNYILNKLNINSRVVTDTKDFRRYKHVYNVIKEKNGKTYSIDLQDDIMNIRTHSRTWSFGLSLDGNSYVIDLNTQKNIHKSIGYVNDTNNYSDDYIYVLKNYLSYYNDFNSKINFILENIDIKKNDINYFERRWMHEKMLRSLFDEKELISKLHTLELFKKNEIKREYINAFYVKNKNNIDIYIYDTNNYKYNKYLLEDYVRYASGNNIESRGNIPGYRTVRNKVLVKR